MEKGFDCCFLVVVGFLLVSASLLICEICKGIPEIVLWFVLWLSMAFFIRRVGVSIEKKDTNAASPVWNPYRRKTLLEEYRELTLAVRARGNQYATVQSLLITGSLVAVSFVFSKMQDWGETFLFPTVVASIFLVLLACALDITTTAIDRVFWNRIHEIEGLVGIEVGHRLLYKKEILGTLWFCCRRMIWPTIFSTLLTFYFYLLLLTLSS